MSALFCQAHQIPLLNGWTSFRSHHQCRRVPLSTFLTSGPVVIFLIFANLRGQKWYPCFDLHISKNYKWIWTIFHGTRGHFLFPFLFFFFKESSVYIFWEPQAWLMETSWMLRFFQWVGLSFSWMMLATMMVLALILIFFFLRKFQT